jgi:hypothetical protein
MKTHQITGLGPVQEDGSVELFTVLPQPFKVTKEWLAAQPAFPAVGNELVEAEDGSMTLTADTSIDNIDQEVQKKTMVGADSSGDGLNPSPLPTYSSKPTTIQAGKIIAVEPPVEGAATTDSLVTLEDGSTRALLAGNICGVGDYWCTDGAYSWYMPAAMFADKFVV